LEPSPFSKEWFPPGGRDTLFEAARISEAAFWNCEIARHSLNRRGMRRGFVFVTCFCFVLFQGCAFQRSASKSLAEKRVREKETRAAALEWLALVDAGNYTEAYAMEPARLRAATTEEQFIRSMEGRRVPFGRVLARSFIGAAFTRKLSGSPDGRYESILFRTSFENKKLAAERVILSYESRQWRVVDYRVY
jgi:hypothetical protein